MTAQLLDRLRQTPRLQVLPGENYRLALMFQARKSPAYLNPLQEEITSACPCRR